MNFGVITQRDIATELASRGISVGIPPPGEAPVEEPVISPPPVVPPPDAPRKPITVLPRPSSYEPYIPFFPPPVVSPEDVTEELVPYVAPIPVVAPTEKKGLDRGLLIVIGITAFALMALSKPPAREKRPRPAPYQRRGFTRRRIR